MSDKTVTKKTVKITESHLIDLINDIVTEAVAEQKQEWINEQAQNASDKTTLLENRLQDLEAKIALLTK